MHRLQQSLGLDEPLEVRVGIETGEAATGVGPTGQLLVTGQVVNAAARLQTAGQPGEVLVGATTYALTKDAVSFGSKQEVEAKGFADALPAYPVRALTTRSSRRTIPFVGRANELDILRGSIARVNATSSPLLVSILGEPGVGKSRLADELLAGLDQDVTVLQGRAYAYGDTATFAPVTAIVREIAGIEDEMAPRRSDASAAGGRRRLLRSERSRARRGQAGPHDRARRPQARGIRLRAGRAERIPESRRGPRRSRARGARVRRRAHGSALRCST